VAESMMGEMYGATFRLAKDKKIIGICDDDATMIVIQFVFQIYCM
jgi:hypothetical protein